jgi:hypothetical protein
MYDIAGKRFIGIPRNDGVAHLPLGLKPRADAARGVNDTDCAVGIAANDGRREQNHLAAGTGAAASSMAAGSIYSSTRSAAAAAATPARRATVIIQGILAWFSWGTVGI